MNPAPNFNATAPNDVKDYSANLWQARKHISDAKKLINATALTPGLQEPDDFQDAIVQRMHLQEQFLNINKYIDEHLDYAKIINLNKMKLRSTLPENVFILNEDSLPTLADSDPWGKIMVWKKMLVGLSFNILKLYSL